MLEPFVIHRDATSGDVMKGASVVSKNVVSPSRQLYYRIYSEIAEIYVAVGDSTSAIQALASSIIPSNVSSDIICQGLLKLLLLLVQTQGTFPKDDLYGELVADVFSSKEGVCACATSF